MKKILFPTEFSGHAPEVFKYAAELAYFFKARLVMMHAMNQPEIKLSGKKELVKKADNSSKELMEFAKTHLSGYFEKVKTEYVIKSGFAVNAILEVIDEENIDIVVMGMKGKTNALEAILGTVSTQVLTKVDCPVLVVPVQAKFAGIDNIVYSTKFEIRDLDAINFLKKWSKVFEATVHCLHVVEHDENAFRARKNIEILKETYKHQRHYLFHLGYGEFFDEVERFAKSKRADILAMTANRKNFITKLLEQNVVTGIAGHFHLPLLVFKDNTYDLGDSPDWIRIANSIA